MSEVTLACARLVREGTVPRSALRSLDHPDVRSEIEARLAGVGLMLATSAYSDHVGIRLSPEVTADTAFDSASNLGLKADACALIVILWARLVLQKRTAQATRSVPGQGALLDADRAEAASEFAPHVRIAALVREFGSVLGAESHIRALLSQLRRLGFVGGRGDVVEAGPLLELGIDGERMTSFIRREVLAQLVAERETGVAAGEAGPDVGEQVLAVLDRLGGSGGIGELERETGEKRPRLRTLLKSLMAEGRVRMSGTRNQARYERVR
jgi:hypothetical protein